MVIYYLSILPIWALLTLHNTWGILNVFYIVWLRPMRGGLIDENHLIATGINPQTKKPIWNDNVIFRSQRKKIFEDDKTDEDIINAVGDYMRKMFLHSVATPEHPQGRPFRMPPAINYIHGSLQYNGGFLIFDDFADAISHFTDWRFKRDFLRFIHLEKREPITVFRNRDYNREEYLEFVCFLRTMFPYFSNSNGNKQRIGWGNPAPYASVNTITGYWKNDTYKFYSEKGRDTLCRPPVHKNYFQEKQYAGPRNYTLPPEKFLARFTDRRVVARGEKGNLFFVDLRKIMKGYRFKPEALPHLLDRLAEKIANYNPRNR